MRNDEKSLSSYLKNLPLNVNAAYPLGKNSTFKLKLVHKNTHDVFLCVLSG